ncbi:MAG: hypothetical protein DHS20C11_36770 [Lysobacteraceae bacterium]|nr:MAG: hypothetical protein DHS20C11_36770 [Xanthomonadaceae bacterium]
MTYDRILLLPVFCLLVANIANATGDSPEHLFDIDYVKADFHRVTPVHNVIDEAPLFLNSSALNVHTQSLTLTLLDGQDYLVDQLDFVEYADDWQVWSGRLTPEGRDYGLNQGYILINRFESRLSSIIHAIDDFGDVSHYQVITEQHYGVKQGDQQHYLLKVEGHAACGVDEGNTLQHMLSTKRPHGIGLSETTNETPKLLSRGLETIDVMSLYAREFLVSQSQEDTARDFIATAFAAANDVWKASFSKQQNPVNYRLAHMGPIPDTTLVLPTAPDTDDDFDDKSVTIAREWLNDNTALTADMRTAYGADMVALWVPLVIDLETDICGIANLPRFAMIDGQTVEAIQRIPGPLEPFSTRAFTAQEVGCGQTDFTYAHEHGHNFGMLHDDSDSHNWPTDPIFDFGVGHRFNVGRQPKASVMGCNPTPGQGDPINGICNRVNHFSNPGVDYMGVATGTVDFNNSEVASLRGGLYADFAATVTQATPTVNIASPADGVTVSGGVSINFSGAASDAEDGNLGSQIQWVSNIEGVIGTGASINEPLVVMGDHVISAIVTDSGNKRVEDEVRVTVQAGEPEIRVTLASTGQTIADGGNYTFPNRSVDDLPFSREFNICNDGTGGLLIDNPGSLVTGEGFTQTGSLPVSPVPGGDCTDFEVSFNVDNPDTYTGAITIQNNDSNEDPYNITLMATATDSSVLLIGSYVTGPDSPRVEFASSSATPPNKDIYFDPNLGRFEERPGAPCNIGGSTNPTYFTLRLGGSVLDNGGIDSCTFGASWDQNQMIPCSAAVVADLNAGNEVIINTMDNLEDTSTCDYRFPLEPHVVFNQQNYMRADFVKDGVTYPRRFNFRQRADVRRYYAEADTYVSQMFPTESYGTEPTMQIRGGAINDAKYVFTRYTVTRDFPFPEIGSVFVSWKVMSNPISDIDFHRVCGNNWDETITWNDWFTETGGSCGILETRNNLAANSKPRFDVTDQFPSGLFANETRSFGGATFEQGDNRSFGTRENTGEANRPVIIVTFDR